MNQEKSILVIGTGEGAGTVDVEKIKAKHPNLDTMAFQRSYPYMESKPDYWFWSDPHASIDGLEQILSTGNFSTKILVPEFMLTDYATFRMYCGTTPLGTVEKWNNYMRLIQAVHQTKCPLQPLKGTTTKYISQNPYSEKTLKGKDWFDTDVHLRFEIPKPIFGSIPFDSEFVIGTRNLWGLENKLSSYVLPLLHHLGYKNVLLCGFGMKGGRWFDKAMTRMPFNDENQKTSQHNIPLDIIGKWANEWKQYHHMNLFSLENEEFTFLNEVMPKYDMK